MKTVICGKRHEEKSTMRTGTSGERMKEKLIKTVIGGERQTKSDDEDSNGLKRSVCTIYSN